MSPSIFSLRDEGRDRVDDDAAISTAFEANEHLDDIERLLPEVRLADEQLVRLHAQALRVRHVERVLRVDERCRDAARSLNSEAMAWRLNVVLPLDSGP